MGGRQIEKEREVYIGNHVIDRGMAENSTNKPHLKEMQYRLEGFVSECKQTLSESGRRKRPGWSSKSPDKRERLQKFQYLFKYDHFEPLIQYAISNLATLSTLPPPLVASFTIVHEICM